MRTTEVTALRVICSAVDKEVQNAAVADQVVNFHVIKQNVTQQIDRIVKDPDFVELFDFIVGLGSTKAAFIPPPLEFRQCFVNSKRRGLRLSAFGVAKNIPDSLPWVKVAVIMRCYRSGQPARRKGGFLGVVPRSRYLLHKGGFREYLEDVHTAIALYFNHLRSEVDNMGQAEALQFKANLAIKAVDGFAKYIRTTAIKSQSVSDARVPLLRGCKEAVGAVALQQHREALAKGLAALKEEQKPAWLDYATLETAVAGATKGAGEQEALQPKVLSFDSVTQLPTNSQSSRTRTASSTWFPLPVAEWRQSEAAKDLGRTEAFSAAAVLTLWLQHVSAVAEANFEIQQETVSGERRVVATADHEAGAIKFWPCAPQTSKLHPKSMHPDRVAVRVCVKPQEARMGLTTLYLHPEFKTPTDTTSAEVADRDPRLRTWRWDASETMHAFWAVGKASLGEVRDTPDGSAVARINMALEEKELAVVVPGVGSKFVVDMHLPVLVNTVPVKKGDELLMEAPPKRKPE